MTREEAIEIIQHIYDVCLSDELREAFPIVIEALEADRPRGEWTKATESIWKCSLCDAIMFTDSNYCPNCGAKMDRERNEENE